MTADVDWPNGWEGGYVKGHDEIRAYWTRQWEEVDSSAEPLAFSTRPDGARRGARAPARPHPGRRGPLRSRGLHVYTFRGDLVEHMSIER